MKIDTSSKVTTARVHKKNSKKNVSGAGFQNELTPSVEKSSLEGIHETVSVQDLVSLQQALLLTEEDKTYVKRGMQMLDSLEWVRRGILTGIFSKDHLEELAKSARESRKDASVQELEDVLGDIELRAEIELAKMEQAQA